MTYIQPSRPSIPQDTDALELAIATFINASQSELLLAMEQLLAEKRRELVVKLILAASFAEKVEIMKLLPLEETGELAQAIAQVWEEGD